jgi:DnaJ-class molecular chaperone
LTVSIAHRTRERIDVIARLSGLARGRVVDLALDALAPCEACQGSGSIEGRACYECGGASVVPSSRTR